MPFQCFDPTKKKVRIGLDRPGYRATYYIFDIEYINPYEANVTSASLAFAAESVEIEPSRKHAWLVHDNDSKTPLFFLSQEVD